MYISQSCVYQDNENELTYAFQPRSENLVLPISAMS
jgi:hypothetical protein